MSSALECISGAGPLSCICYCLTLRDLLALSGTSHALHRRLLDAPGAADCWRYLPSHQFHSLRSPQLRSGLLRHGLLINETTWSLAPPLPPRPTFSGRHLRAISFAGATPADIAALFCASPWTHLRRVHITLHGLHSGLYSLLVAVSRLPSQVVWLSFTIDDTRISPQPAEFYCALLQLCHTRLVSLQLFHDRNVDDIRAGLGSPLLRHLLTCAACRRAEGKRTAPSTLQYLSTSLLSPGLMRDLMRQFPSLRHLHVERWKSPRSSGRSAATALLPPSSALESCELSIHAREVTALFSTQSPLLPRLAGLHLRLDPLPGRPERAVEDWAALLDCLSSDRLPRLRELSLWEWGGSDDSGGEHWRRVVERHRSSLEALELECAALVHDDDVDAVLAAGGTRGAVDASTPTSSAASPPNAQWPRLRRLRMWVSATDMSPQRVQRLLDAVTCRRIFPALRGCDLSFHFRDVGGVHPSVVDMSRAANAALREGLMAVGLWQDREQQRHRRVRPVFLQELMREVSPAASRAGASAVRDA